MIALVLCALSATPSIGITCIPVADATQHSPPTKAGMYVIGVLPNSPAEAAKITQHSVITALDGKLLTAANYDAIIAALPVGKAVRFSAHIATAHSNGRVTWQVKSGGITAQDRKVVVLGGFTRSTDAFTGETTYGLPPRTDVDSTALPDVFLTPITTASGAAALRVAFVWRGKAIGITQCLANIDGNLEQITFAPSDVKLGNGLERATWTTTAADRRILKAMADGTEVKLRFEGNSRRGDYTLTAEQMDRLGLALSAYSLLGGK